MCVMSGKIKMRIKGKLYTGQSVYDCLCQAVRQPINIHAKMVDVHKLVSKKPITKKEDKDGIY